MKNVPIGDFESEEIRGLVSRVLRDVSAVEPPLDLNAVRGVLKLDLGYYSASDPSLRQEVVHRVRVGAHLLAKKVARSLLEVAEKARLWGIWLPQPRRILICEDAPKPKHRWIQAHEIGHSLIPHHARFLFGDPEETLSLACQEQLEREANFAAGQLTFLQGRFVEEALDQPVNLNSIIELADAFGNTKTSTLWRFVEEAHAGRSLVGIVSASPWAAQDGSDPCRHCIESPAFRERFGRVSGLELYGALRTYCSRRRGGPLGQGEVLLEDANGERHLFQFESWSNTHEVLTLGVHLGPIKTQVGLA